MGAVGLLLVGPVLFVNGLAVLGVVRPRGAAPLNFFVGGAQVVLPTIILAQAGGDAALVDATWPSYLFGFTYLFYALLVTFDLEPEGMGWFSVFVAAVALFHAVTTWGTDPVFAVIWFTWAVMWSLFFALMALGRAELGRFTGWFLVLLGIPTCTVAGVAMLRDAWPTSSVAGWLAVAGLLWATVVSLVLAHSRLARPADDGASVAGASPVEVALPGDGATLDDGTPRDGGAALDDGAVPAEREEGTAGAPRGDGTAREDGEREPALV